MVIKENLIAPKNYNIAMEVARFAKKDPNKLALIWKSETGQTEEMTYSKLVTHANKIGNVLLEHGLKRGDKILVMIPRLIETYEVYLAALKTGIIIVPSSEMLKTSDLQYRITHGEIDAIISYYPFVNQFSDIKEYDHLIKFVVGQPKEGWLFLDKIKKSMSEELKIAQTTRDDIAFL